MASSNLIQEHETQILIVVRASNTIDPELKDLLEMSRGTGRTTGAYSHGVQTLMHTKFTLSLMVPGIQCNKAYVMPIYFLL